MSYKVEEMDYNSALETVKNYSYVLLYKYSALELRKAGDIGESDWTECYEARAFDQSGELHLLLGDEKKAYVVEDTDDSCVLTSEYELSGKYKADGQKTVVVKQYLEADHDGQMRIVLTRLAGIK